MEKINDISEIKGAIKRHFRPGAATNTVLTDADYTREIAGGALYMEESENALYILRSRGTHFILNYYVNALPLPPLGDGVYVTEIPARGEKNLPADIIAALEGMGFQRVMGRVRLLREPCETPEDNADDIVFRRAAEGEESAVSELLAASFDGYTGCLSTADVMAENVKNGDVYTAFAGGELIAALETAGGGSFTNIRHLAVSEKARGRGLAGRMVRFYLRETAGKRSFVWTNPENPAAYHNYLKCGYTGDGHVSVVLKKG